MRKERNESPEYNFPLFVFYIYNVVRSSLVFNQISFD